MNVRPVLLFLFTFIIGAPIIAIAGGAARGNWAPAGLMIAGGLVAWTGIRVIGPIRETVARFGGFQQRVLVSVWIIVITAGLVAAGSAFWLGGRLVG